MRAVQRRVLTAALLFTIVAPGDARAQQRDDVEDTPIPTIAEKTEDMQRIDGFMPLYWSERDGRMWLEIPRLDEEILYYVSLPAGVGHNDIGLNRGDLGPSYVVEFERVGPKIMMVQPNYDFRATTDNAMERKSVEDAFAQSIIWGFTVAAQTGDRVLVDATDFFVRDAHGVIGTLRRGDQGTFRMDESRSAFYIDRTKGFPKNTEVEVTLTFTSDAPGGLVRSVTPTPAAVTVRQHHSFVELPTGYTPRESDPRAGYFGTSFTDFAVPIGEPMTQRWIARHRLEKVDPSAPVSDAVEPIVYYLDPGTPEPVRSALLEGGNWWQQAFEAAGYRNAFRVEMLPDTADPMDLSYNVIQWVHRSTRGWSYGSSITDPRTGEILKGHVTLGSLRVRQDYLLAEGLLSPYETGDEVPPELEAMALARLRQLSAHEIGHTLGIAHNYIASTQGEGGRASVMDYPHPLAQLTSDGDIDLSNAYDQKIGEWDKLAVAYGYQDFPAGVNEEAALDSILDVGARRGLTFLSDQDARPVGSAHPQSHLWDNGANAVRELERMLEVREVALERFGEGAIRSGRPLAMLEEALVPLYLHHRYQTEAAVKTVGGAYYNYALRGETANEYRRVPASEQREALEAVLSTITPATLKLPRSVVDVLPPRPYGVGGSQELFDRYTGLVFDAVAPAASAADMSLSLLLEPQRAARLVQQNALDPSLPGLADVLETSTRAIMDPDVDDAYEAEIARAVQRVYIDRLMTLAENAPMAQVRALANYELTRVLERALPEGGDAAQAAHRLAIAAEIGRFMERPLEPIQPRPAAPGVPPGQPIGMPAMTWTSLSCDW
ncbi:MAG TPA: zinc-dependent metalloprotease [Longimicrobiales bacterium]|nr:zinc-dependent metalloprotease [Longimicrobiales bacterium]